MATAAAKRIRGKEREELAQELRRRLGGTKGSFYSIINTAFRLVRGSSGTRVRRQSPAEPPPHEPCNGQPWRWSVSVLGLILRHRQLACFVRCIIPNSSLVRLK